MPSMIHLKRWRSRVHYRRKCAPLSLSLSLYIYIYIYIYTHTHTYAYMYVNATSYLCTCMLLHNPHSSSGRNKTKHHFHIHKKFFQSIIQKCYIRCALSSDQKKMNLSGCGQSTEGQERPVTKSSGIHMCVSMNIHAYRTNCVLLVYVHT
jgi:hypothetical protein